MTTIVDGNSGGTTITDTTITSYVPSGVVFPYSGSTAPTGFLLCYGQSVSTTTYAALFAIIGYTYGGSGANFTIPDLRGRSVFGKDNMGGTAANRITAAGSGVTGTTLGASGGSEFMQSHYHTFLQGDSTPASYTSRAGQGDGNNNYYTNTTAYGSGASQNMPPAFVLNYIIKT